VQGEKKAAPSGIAIASGKRPMAASGALIVSRQVPSSTVPRPAPRSQTRVPTGKRSLCSTVPAASTPGT